MKIEDHFTVTAPQETVWAAITDPDVIGPCVPGCKGIEVVSPELFKVEVGLSVGPVKAAFALEVEVVEQDPPSEVRTKTRGQEGSMASTVKADSLLRLESLSGTETKVIYESEVAIAGRLGKFGFGVVKKKAESLGKQFAAAFRERVEARVAVP